jgi:PAS domain S-box-containing protein
MLGSKEESMRSNQPFPASRTSAAQCMHERKEEILSLWEERVRQELRAANGKRHYVLVDSLPQFIEALTHSIEDRALKPEVMKDLAQMHALQRTTLDDYTLEQVQAEYKILRQVIFQVLEKHSVIDRVERDIILDFLTGGMHAAIALESAKMGARQYNEAIRNERAWFQMALNAVPTPIFLIDSKTHEVFFENEASRKMNEAIPRPTPIARLGDSFATDRQGKRIPTEELPRYRVLRGEEIRDFELTWHTEKGEIPLLLDGKLLPAAYERPPMGMLSFRDITPIKKAETELRRSEEKFRIVFESDLMGVVFGNIGGGMYDMNEQFLHMLGYSRQELTDGKLSWKDLTPKDYLHLDDQAISEMNRFGRCKPYEKPFIRKDGKWVWIMLTAIFSDKSHFDHVAIVIDVSDLKHTREALEDRERRLRLLTESIPQIVWTARSDGLIEEVNRNWYIFTGLPPEKGQGNEWTAVVHPDDREKNMEAWKHAIRIGDVFTFEHRIRRYDGVYRWFLTRAQPLRDPNGNIVQWFGTSTDIDEQKRTQHALERERELREQFVNTLSHDLRNPLSAARTSAQLIARYPDKLDRTMMLASRIMEYLTRADQMIEDLLDANRIRAGKGLPIEPEECDLVRITEKVRDETNSIYGDRVRIEATPPIKGYWSAKNLQRLLENLITNAIKYGFRDTPVTVRIKEQGESVELSVHNFGNAISPGDQKHLFDPFMRTRNALLDRKKGWGLGLTLVRGVTEAHGGRISVKSNPEEGTTFTMTLPRDARTHVYRAAS